MAKLTGPLLSFGADGQIGKAMVTAKWRGISYARQYVKPANPQTTAQQANRALFAFLREMWKMSPSIVREPWTSFAQGRPFTNFNKYVGENVRVIGSDTDLQAMLFSPGAKGGLPPTGFSATTGSGSGEIDVDFTVPTGPDGWTLYASQFAAVVDQDGHGIFDNIYVADEETSAPWDGTLTGLPVATACVVGGWLKWQKPDGTYAYSVSLVDTATSGA